MIRIITSRSRKRRPDGLNSISVRGRAGNRDAARQLPEGFGDGPLVFVELVGGLGNQLFGFAAATAQARRLGGRVVMGHVIHNGDTPREFALHGFTDDIACTGPLSLARQDFVEAGYRYDPTINSIGDRTLLRGYFQSERYFANGHDFRDQVFTAMERAGIHPYRNEAREPFIAVHVRGGDYRLAHNLRHHGMCSKDFYQAAVEVIRSQVGDLPVTVFSDDLEGFELVEQAVPRARRYDRGPATDALRVLRDMSTAAGFVISNSTFGWWGAWLSGAKEVVAPSPWFSDPAIDTTDLLPSTWNVLPR